MAAPPPGNPPTPTTPVFPSGPPPNFLSQAPPAVWPIPTATPPLNRTRPRQPPCTVPNNTLYVQNLNEKIAIPVLKKALEAVFKDYGHILDIVAHSNLRMRGQAFVVFKDVESATKAIQELQGFPLYDKPMSLSYGRTKSDATVVMEGGDIEEHKRERKEIKEAKKAAQARPVPAPGGFPAPPGGQSMYYTPGPGAPMPNLPDEFLPPNKILFVQQLPDDITQDALTGIFRQYPGFKEVRMVPGKKDIAFIEYENEAQAGVAKEGLQGFPIAPEKAIKVTFARK